MTPEQIIAKLRGLSRKVTRLQNVRYEGRDWHLIADEIEKFVENNIGHDAWQAIHSALNPARIRVRMDTYPIGDNVDPTWKAERVEAVQTQLQILERDLKAGYRLPSEQAIAPHATETYIPPGRPHEAYTLIRSIVEQARQTIVIVDPWVDRTLFPLLGNATANAKIRLLTRNTPPDFGLELEKFRQQGFSIEARRQVRDFHDRFILVDNLCFHVGASIKDAGDKGFMIQQLEDEVNIATLRKNIEAAWSNSPPAEVPVSSPP